MHYLTTQLKNSRPRTQVENYSDKIHCYKNSANIPPKLPLKCFSENKRHKDRYSINREMQLQIVILHLPESKATSVGDLTFEYPGNGSLNKPQVSSVSASYSHSHPNLHRINSCETQAMYFPKRIG